MSGQTRAVSRLQAVRESLKLARSEVAPQLGLSEQQLYRIEVGITPPKRAYLVVLAGIYGVAVEELEEERSAA